MKGKALITRSVETEYIKASAQHMINHYLVFNGDADGICAAHQYYLNSPIESTAVTGVKRDISLLKKIDSLDNAEISVFDIAVEKNLLELEKLLTKGCSISWFDHHVSNNIPRHQNLRCQIDTSPLVNTSYLVSQYLKNTSLWAIVGLCGDNIFKTAELLARESDLTSEEYSLLKEMGELFNYNGYGEAIDDLHIHPAEILASMKSFESPFDYLKNTSMVSDLRNGLAEDLTHAKNSEDIGDGVFLLPEKKWARRVVGVFANRVTTADPEKACSVLVEKDNGQSYVVSVRSPLDSNKSAADLCKQFPTGGGRVKAAGINHLPKEELSKFIDQFRKFYSVG